jgi:DNA repair protein RadC
MRRAFGDNSISLVVCVFSMPYNSGMSETNPTTETGEAETSVSKSSNSNPTIKRYHRYKSVIEFVSNQPTFELGDAKQACPSEKPGFVTRIVNELEKNGWIVRESLTQSAYRWNQGRGKFSTEKWLDEKIFGSQIQLSPTEERPRERLLAQGVENLRTSELLAILIRSGRPGESAVTAGEKIAKHYQERLADLPAAGRGELKSVSHAIEVTAYCQIMAGIELGRRVADESGSRKTFKIQSSSDAVEFCEQRFARLISDAKQEEFHIVTLDTKNQVIDTHQITVGTLDASLVHPREVFRAAIKDAASSIILVHNHPSGDPTPSREDIAVTTRLEDCGKTLGIDVLDHIVLGSFQSISIREHRAG